MKFKLAWTSLCLALTFVASQASAERLVLRLRGNDPGQRILLKQELQRQYPRLRLDQYDLRGVELVAKSRFGRGQVDLFVGGRTVDWGYVDGRPADWFDDRDRRSWDVVRLSNRGYSEGVWQLHFRGNFKVQQIVVDVEQQRGRWQDDRRDRRDDRDHRRRPDWGHRGR